MAQLLIVNGSLVNEGRIQQADILINQGWIEAIGKDLSARPAKRVIDAAGCFVLPGMIDDQVHFREPGLTHKGTIASESRAAIAGGITSFMEMPNCKPATTHRQAILAKRQLAAQTSYANYAFYLGATNDNLEEIKSLDPALVCGVKVFMGASTGNMLVDKPEVLEAIFQSSPVLIATHCEDTPMIMQNEQKYRAEYGDVMPFRYHADIRSREACYKSSSLAVNLAKRFGAKLHVLHLTTKEELGLFEAGPVTDKKITAEACVHHLHFSLEDYETLGAKIKCNPSIKESRDRDALLEAVRSDVIDIIATDHAPHTREEKSGNYWQAPAGLPLVQHALLSLLEHYHQGMFTLEKIVEKTSHNVAIRYGVQERGFIREGYRADLVVVDCNQLTSVTDQDVLYQCQWSPFSGISFRSRILYTLLNGSVVCENGKVAPQAQSQAEALKFLRS